MGIVYILECNITGDRYIGSTMISLEERYGRHRRDKSCVSRYIIERGNHSVRALEVVDTSDRRQLEIREQYWMDNYDCINHKRAYTSDEQRKEQVRELNRQYHIDHYEDRRYDAKKYYYENYDKVREGDKRRKSWRRSWKADGRMGFYNDLLDIDPSLFD